jgi:site-specific DNA-methyltransferase (adenine-specific)
LAALPESSVDSVVTDPPYHLTSIVKRYGKTSIDGDGTNEKRAKARSDAMARTAGGFMGKTWDGGDIAQRADLWALVARVLRPGGHVVAFSGTRTQHRMVCAIEDAGLEIRDQLAWCYGSGFPKSHNVGNGWGTALKPAWEPICLARKPLIGTVAANVLEHGTGALNIDGCRVETDENLNGGSYSGERRNARADSAWQSTDRSEGKGAGLRNGIGEFVQPPGRWPANLIHDGSEEVVGAFPETGGGGAPQDMKRAPSTVPFANGREEYTPFADTLNGGGSAARFFYTAKADAEDRLGSKHPTVKPLDLMQWLVRLVTPKGGIVLDPFAGTGTTGEAAWREGTRAILIEREPEYQADIARRMDLALKPTKRAAVAASKNQLQRPEDLPLFSLGEKAG